MSSSSFFITTPIYYSNGVPHIGHAYASLLADSIARYQRLSGNSVRFSTGVDENSQKVVESAEGQGMSVMEYADMMAEKHRAVWDGIDIRYTDFVRTTNTKHADFVQSVLQKTFDNGDIYEWVYQGAYCVGCEAFKTEKDLVNGRCTDHPNKEIRYIKEKNYFFRLSRYQDRLLEWYQNNPDWVTPRSRYNEIIEFVRGGLEDFSVSRETNTFGIPLPFDPTQVTYVWFDALYNYISVLDGDMSSWPAHLHVVGKDILKFHGIYWPAMLWSAGYELPRQILATGFFTIDGQKMSKTLGNVIDPVKYSQEYGRDALLLYLFTAFPIGEDGDFDQKQALITYNAKLSNNLWNLLNRAIALSLKIGWVLQKHEDVTDLYGDAWEKYHSAMTTYRLKDAMEIGFEYATMINKYVDDTTPWKLDIENPDDRKTLENILYTLLFHLRRVGIILMPFFEDKMREMLARIGADYDDAHNIRENWHQNIDQFTITEKGNPLYARISVE